MGRFLVDLSFDTGFGICNGAILPFDDDLFSDELIELQKHDSYDNWIEVNLSKNPEQLADFIRSFPIPSVIG